MNIPISVPWLGDVLPQGFSSGQSIVVTGPGGSGKPLIGDAFLRSWLHAGGSVVFLSLQYPDPTFLYESYRRVTGDELSDHEDRLAFVELDPSIEGLGGTRGNRFAANVLVPDTLSAAIQRGYERVTGRQFTERSSREAIEGDPAGPGVMVFASALNLLMFSPTWGAAVTRRFVEIMGDPSLTCLLSVSEKPHAPLVDQIVAAADTVLVSERALDDLKLTMRVQRSSVQFVPGTWSVPIPEEELRATKSIAERSRNKIIPQISAI